MLEDNKTQILELVEKSAAQDEDAFEQLLAIYESSFKKKARLYFLKGGDNQDLLQAMRCGLVKAVKLYEQSKGSFDCFVSICVKSELFDIIKQYNSQKQSVLSACSDIDSDIVAKLAAPITDEFFDSELELHALSAIEKKYGKDDKALFVLYLSGYSYDEMAKSLSLTTKQVDNKLMRIKRFLEKNIKMDI